MASVPVLALAAASGWSEQQRREFRATPLEPASRAITRTVKRDRAAATRGLTSVIVKFDEDSVVAALARQNPNKLGRADLRSPSAAATLERLAARRRVFEDAAARAVPGLRVVHDLSFVFGGVSVIVPEGQVDALRGLPGVRRVYPDELLQLETDRSPQFIRANRLWSLGAAGRGQGVIVGVLDTGIWPEHPSYSDPDPAGTPYPAPVGWSGSACEFGSAVAGDAPFTCNNKLIGAERFMATYDAVIGLLPTEFPSARDDNGHGTHTSSTAAGNRNVPASVFGVRRGRVSGVAPRAQVAMYKVCGDLGCFQSDSAAAIQRALLDGVDVINFSMNGGSNPYADAVSLAFLDAYAAGVFVAASAGNSGPGPDTVDHREPWVTTVGASTTDRHFLSDLTVMGDNGDTLALPGATITHGIAATPLVVAADAPFNDALCLNGTPDGAFAGKIVVCQRGTNAPVENSFNVQQRGGVGMILYNPVPQGLATDNHFVPSVHLENDAGAALLAFLAGHSGESAMFTQGTATTVQGDVMAAFSSRGGPGQTLGISKPDVTAPGVQILAGNTPLPATVFGGAPGEFFQVIQGTSLSSPHTAGAAALLRALHPTWTPGQVKSALMTTALRDVVNEDGVTPTTPFDDGSGRIRPRVANNPGITFDESAANYLAHQANLSKANYPSLYVPTLPGLATVQRTVHSLLGGDTTWKLRVNAPADLRVTVPSAITVPGGGDTTFEITVDASLVPVGEVRHANINLRSGARRANIPVTVVRRDVAVTFIKTCALTDIPLGGTSDCTITLTNTSFDPATVDLVDQLPTRLLLTSVSGATQITNRLFMFNGVLDPAEPPNVAIGPGASPAGSYLPLSLFGIAPIDGMGDETIVNFNVPTFDFGGEAWNQVGVVSNGYVVIGGGTGADVEFINQNLPDLAPPNNVLAPFWTDLNPGAAGAVRIAALTDGIDTWIVVDWEAVPSFSSPAVHSFQVWIGINADSNPAEDISYAFGLLGSAGDGGFLTVGAENKLGNRGDMEYSNGTGTLPANGTQLRVTTTPVAPGETHTINFTVRGVARGSWRNCAQAVAPAIFFGTAVACEDGNVIP